MGKLFSHVSYVQRCQIQALLDVNISKSEIARRVGISRATLYNELARGTVSQLDTNLKPYKKYFADTGQIVYEKHRQNCGCPYKAASVSEFLSYAEEQILINKFSPDVIVGRCRRDSIFPRMVCTSTLYNYIDLGLLKVKNLDLLRRVGRKTNSERSRVNLRLFGMSIEARPDEINNRLDFGHWEIDTIVGKKDSSDVFLSLDERLTRFRHVVKIPSRSAESVKLGLEKIFSSYPEKSRNRLFKSVTSDNGSEFASLPKQLPDIDVYYSHPYSSWERGTNENQNSLVRRFFPKGSDFANVSDEALRRVQDWINNLPRKIFGYSSSSEMFSSYVNAFGT